MSARRSRSSAAPGLLDAASRPYREGPPVVRAHTFVGRRSTRQIHGSAIRQRVLSKSLLTAGRTTRTLVAIPPDACVTNSAVSMPERTSKRSRSSMTITKEDQGPMKRPRRWRRPARPTRRSTSPMLRSPDRDPSRRTASRRLHRVGDAPPERSERAPAGAHPSRRSQFEGYRRRLVRPPGPAKQRRRSRRDLTT